jgi:hypothetical protein
MAKSKEFDKEHQPKRHFVWKMLSCGVDESEFESKYDSFSPDTQDQLYRVAWRMWIAQILRYQVMPRVRPWSSRDDFDRLVAIEWPSLEIYLLFNCLDTLAPNVARKNFPEWIKAQNNIPCLNQDEIAEQYMEWTKEYGVGAKLRGLFTHLPDGMITWLTDNMIVQRAKDEFDPKGQREIQKQVDLIYQYFYNVRRNLYTHSSTSAPTYVTPYPSRSDNWELLKEYRIDDRDWRIYSRSVLDEATILRMIVQAVVLQKLHVEVNFSTIQANLANYSRQSVMYNFLSEVQVNAAALIWWPEFDQVARRAEQSPWHRMIGKIEWNASDLVEWRQFNGDQKVIFYESLAFIEVPCLNIKWSTIMAEQFVPQNEREYKVQQLAVSYLAFVKQLDSAIRQFNELHPPSPFKWAEREKTLKKFLQSQTGTQAFDLVTQMPSRSEMGDLAILAQYPCL